MKPNLAVHGTFWGWSAKNPDAESDALGKGELEGEIFMSAFGVRTALLRHLQLTRSPRTPHGLGSRGAARPWQGRRSPGKL